MKRIALFDGDVNCHAACGQPWQAKLAIWKRLGLDVDLLKGAKEIPGYDAHSDTKMIETCWSNFKKEISSAMGSTFTDEFLMAVKAGRSYRDDIYSDYKRDRGKWRIPNPFVDIIRERAVNEGYAVYAHEKEADDLIRIWAEECRSYDKDYVIVSIDKDLYCIPGKHYNPSKKKILTISPEEAMWHYYSQLLAGDPTDHIPGLPGVGFKTAVELIENLPTEEDCQEVVVSMYIDKFEDDWDSQLLSNGKMIHIQRHWNDHFTIKDWPIVQEIR